MEVEEFARSVTGCSRFIPMEPAVRDCWLPILGELVWTALRVLVTKIKGCSRGCVGTVSAYLVVRLPLPRGQRRAARLKGGRALIPAVCRTIRIFERMLLCAAHFYGVNSLNIREYLRLEATNSICLPGNEAGHGNGAR